MSFSAGYFSGSGALTSGSLSLAAVGCPGPACALRLNDLLARANQIDASVTVDVLGIPFTEGVDVSDAVITNVRPTTLQAASDGNLPDSPPTAWR